MQPTTRVAVIGENRLARERLSALLNGQPDFTVVATAEGPHTGLVQVRQTRPHVVLVDASMGHGSSHPFVATVRREVPAARVIVLDLLPLPNVVVDFVRAGATGFVAKRADVGDLVATVRAAAAGAVGAATVPACFTQALFAHIADAQPQGAAPPVRERVAISRREREVIGLLGEGLSNKEIAERLHVATHTVKSHVHHILQKLALRSRVEVVAHAPSWLRASAPSPNGLARSMQRAPGDSPSVVKPSFSPLSDVRAARLRPRSSLSVPVP